MRQSELRRQRDILQHILSSIPHFVFWKDKDSVYLGCNELFATAAGVANAAEIVGKTDYELAWKDQADWYRKCDRDVMESGEPLMGIEEPQTRSDGTETVILTSKVPLRDEGGGVCGILGIYTDITERKRTERLIQDMALFPTENPWPVFRIGADGTVMFANSASLALPESYGITEGNKVAEEWQELVRGALDSGTVMKTEIEQEDAVLSVQIVPIDGKNYVNFYGADITQIRVTQRESERVSRFLMNVLESLNHPFCVIDVNTYEVKLANSAAGEYSQGTKCHALTHGRNTPCSGEGHVCPMEEVKKTGKPVIAEHLHVDSNGESQHVEVHAYPLLDSDDGVSEIIHYSLDITDRKKSEAKLLRAVEQLSRFNRLAVGREMKMIELKEEINGLLEELGRRAKYEPTNCNQSGLVGKFLAETG